MDLSSRIGDFTLRSPIRNSNVHPLSSTPSTTYYSPKVALLPKMTTPIDCQRPAILKQKNSTEITPPATPLEDPPTTLLPSDFARYETMLRESVLARKNRKVRSFTPLHNVERIHISRNGFHKLDEALGGTESDFRYSSSETLGKPLVVDKTIFQMAICLIQFSQITWDYRVDALRCP